MSRRKKQPKLKGQILEFQPEAGSAGDFRGHDIGWQFTYIDLDGPFGWERCSRSTLIGSIFDRVKSIESMLWKEILGRHLHAIPVWRLDKLALDRLQAIGQDDVEELYCLRVEKRPRIWGIRDRMFFMVLWWDPEHQVYPMNIADN